MDTLARLFKQHFHSLPESSTPVQGELGGSGRRILRLTGAGHTAIGILYGVREENVAFLTFSRHFGALGLPVPQIYAEDLDNGAYLLQDLGDTTLYQFLQAHRDGEVLAAEVIDAYRKVVQLLPRFQLQGVRGLDTSVCYPRAAFDRQSIAWDLNYFKYYFLRLAGLAFSEQALEDDFQRLTDFLLLAPSDYFLYRDFQSRNIMLVQGEPYFLDYQGGRRGALQYDVASLLYDAKADLPPAVREQLLHTYLDELQKHAAVDRADFLRFYPAFVLVRILQALGAYGFRGYYERKPHFLASVPYALRNLQWLLSNADLQVELPTITAVCNAMIASPALQSLSAQPAAAASPLRVRITSFSFHQGLPQDSSGHGGGFIFDARSLPNPGRDPQFRKLTGRDAPVKHYLARETSVEDFFAHACALVEQSVRSYQQRGFDSLSVNFGCTGGQHRSVYLAEKLAAHLRDKPGLTVTLQHRELERMGML
jgi:aminoglycoside/choline kinase family phosphotransferase